jgi:general secretion pathway protein K
MTRRAILCHPARTDASVGICSTRPVTSVAGGKVDPDMNSLRSFMRDDSVHLTHDRVLCPQRRSGFALMAALWLVVIIGVTGYELSVRSRVRRLAVANSLEKVAADAAADAALETVRATLENRLAHPLDSRTRSLADATFDPWSDLALMRTDTLRLGDERATARFYDAGTRLQLNRVTEADIRRLLIAIPLDAGSADRLAQRIMDWRDADTFRRSRGMERDDYLRVGARTLPADADFGRVEELRDVDGVTAEVYERIAPYFTVSGSGQVNLNSASRAVLSSLPGLGDEAVSFILRAQQNRVSLRSLEEITQRLSGGARSAIVDAGADLTQRVTFETREVVVEAQGWLDGSPLRSRGEAVYVRGGDALFTTWRRVGL